jgi:hypothetical protein
VSAIQAEYDAFCAASAAELALSPAHSCMPIERACQASFLLRHTAVLDATIDSLSQRADMVRFCYIEQGDCRNATSVARLWDLNNLGSQHSWASLLNSTLPGIISRLSSCAGTFFSEDWPAFNRTPMWTDPYIDAVTHR